MTTEHVGTPRAILIVAENGALYAFQGGNVSFDGCTFSTPSARTVVGYFLKQAFREVLRNPLGLRAR